VTPRRSAGLAGLGLVASLLVGCGSVELPSVPPPPPAPPTIQVVGVLADEQIADPKRTYTLADGRTVDVDTRVTRIAFEGGLGHPFVLGTDADGPFLAGFEHQDGLPDDCHIVPAGGPGIERGPYVEIKGILWKKAVDFHSDIAPPLMGEEWGGGSTRFCFNERAEVTSAVP
jgi:hypothetical protein